tara:strand:+ start:64 stop:462 length:399 start_codon:yes stop_codon:yes gene_type:complete
MNKEQLKVKLETLEANLEAKRSDLNDASTAVAKAKQEIANAGKPVISESVVADLTEQLVEMFADVVGNADPCDMSPEFALNYNEISLECLDMSNIGVSEHDIHSILEDFFAIEEDEDEDLESISSTGREGRE